jgi:FkbM family methyltransferase
MSYPISIATVADRFGSLRQRVRRLIAATFDRVGLYAGRRSTLPRGTDWLLDVERLFSPDQPRTVFDVGANIGQTTASIRRRFPAASIHAFEPVSSTFASLHASVGHLSGVHCLALALSDDSGTRTISALPGSVFNSLNTSEWINEQNPGHEQIAVDTIDRFLVQHSVPAIDLLKVDTEGHDLAVLQGAKTTLAREGRRVIYVEVTFSEENTQNSNFFAIYEYLDALDYRFMGLYELDYFQVNPWDRSFCNALFWKPQ